jgi:hypothetical protein
MMIQAFSTIAVLQQPNWQALLFAVVVYLFFLLYRPAFFAVVATMKHQPPVIYPGYSRCPTCEQDELCSDCGKCHYCDDVALPCSSVGVRSLSLGATQTLPSIINALPSHQGREDEEDAPVKAAAGEGGNGNNTIPPVDVSFPEDFPERYLRRECEAQRIYNRVSQMLLAANMPTSQQCQRQKPYQHPPTLPILTIEAVTWDNIVMGGVIPTPRCGIHPEFGDGGLEDLSNYPYHYEVDEDEQTNGEQDESNTEATITTIVAQTILSKDVLRPQV